VSADGIRIVFGNRRLLTRLLFGWLAGFYIVPEGSRRRARIRCTAAR
jgi:hypothetical protein